MPKDRRARVHERKRSICTYIYVSYCFCIHECTSYLVTTRDVKPEVTYWSHDLYKPMRAKLVPIKGRVSQNKLRVFMALNPVTSIL